MRGGQVKGDKKLIKVLIENLLVNAWKYSSSRDNAIIEFGHKTIDDEEVYYVKDNGIGFDNELSEKVFTPFNRLDNTYDIEGTGIGLATVQRIINRHNGKIWAEGEQDKGATFYFTLHNDDIGKSN